MAPTSTRIPLLLFFLLLLCLVYILLFAPHLTSPIPTASPAPLAVVDRYHYNTLTTPPDFTLILKVLTFNRLSSLTRCLNSLARAHYDNSTTVHLHIFIDHFLHPSPSDPKGSLNLEERLNLSRKILDFVDGFRWDFGDKLVHYRTSNAGLQAQWLEAWWPASDHEFVFVVEDDMEVSPLYFNFFKALILNYYYNQSNFSPMIYGASLQRPRLVPGKHGNKMKVDSNSTLFLYQLVGTWGQLLFPRPWKEFRFWYDMHKAKGLKPFLDGMVTTGWYQRMGERIWTPWFIKFVHARGYFNIYTSLKNGRAFSVSHRDAGVDYKKSAGPDSNLVGENFNDDMLLALQPLSGLKWYDFCFSEVVPNRVARDPVELEKVLHAIQKSNTVILVNLQRASESKVRNLLCHFERLAIENHILIGPKSALLFDLSRRGHLVIDVDQLSESAERYKPLNLEEPSKELVKEILGIAFVIKKSLELNYDTWVVDCDMLPLSGSLHFDLPRPTNDFYVGEKSKLLFTRSSISASKSWDDDFAYKILAAASSSKADDSVSLEGIFVHSVQRVLEQNGIKYHKINEAKFGLYLDTLGSNLTFPGDEKKFVFWSSQVDTYIVQKKLKQMAVWIVDGDLSCKAVFCHASKI